MFRLSHRRSWITITCLIWAGDAAAAAGPRVDQPTDAPAAVASPATVSPSVPPFALPPAVARAARALERPVDVLVVKQDLAAALQMIAEQAGVRVTLGKGMARTLTNLHLKGSTSDALDMLAEQIGAVWWWTGTDVRLVDRSDLVTKTLKLRDFDRTLATAKSLGLPVDLLTAQKAEGSSGIVRVSGPSGLVAELETLAQDVTEQEGKIHVTRYGKRRGVTTR